jgi:nonsense-mediated mRNA decay protein 3|tara:strand:+ start:242 stop:1825 length:1584 start_codon:yes stop_codon:yes gene_type:complete
MDFGASNAMHAGGGAATVLCCLCGVPMCANPSGMCVECVRTQVDITEGISKSCVVQYCSQCERYLQPPKHWIRADLESKELLTFCIKRIKGLQKVKLVDAGFVWTEPHSKRLKTKLTIQKEVLNGAILQQTFVTEFVVEWRMCDACARSAANSDQWNACVQVRQKVEHKRTFLFLEQMILKHGMERDAIGIKSQPDGLDFYYGHRSHALRFVDFLGSVVATRSRADKQLVSHDANSNTYNYRHTFMTEIVPVCKEDVVVMPFKLSKEFGSVGPVMLCTRVSNSLQFTDPVTMRQVWIDPEKYWRYPFKASASAKQMIEYVILDVEVDHSSRQGKLCMADVEVARASDFGTNDTTFFVKTHLGNILQPGDTAMGYDLSNLQIVDPELEKYSGKLQGIVPDVILVKKSYAESRRKRRERGVARAWRLQRMQVEEADDSQQKSRGGVDRMAQDEELFYQELEEDEETRAHVQIFKDENAINANAYAASGDDDDDVPEVPIEELLDELSLLHRQEDHEGDEGDDLDDSMQE